LNTSLAAAASEL